MNLLAIDPGKSGGIAYYGNFKGTLNATAFSMPETEGDIIDALRLKKFTCEVCFLEEVGGYVGGKGQPGSSMFKFGRNYGFLIGVLQTLGYRIVLVRPQKWQKHFSLGKASECASQGEWKNKLKAEAQRRFPHLKVTLKTADALLLLEYGISTLEK